MFLIFGIIGLFSFAFLRSLLTGVPSESGLKSFVPVMIVIALKYLLLFILDPGEFMTGLGMAAPGGFFVSNLMDMFQFGIIFLPAIMFLLYSRDFYELSMINLSLVIGCSVAPAVGFVFFPEMIGTRETNVGGISFSGSFWNSSVIGVVATLWSSLSLWEHYSRGKKWSLIALLTFIVLGAMVGLSRTAFVCLGGSFMAYLSVSKGFFKKTGVAVVILAGLFVFFKSFDAVTVNLEKRMAHESDLKEDSRVRLWKDYYEHLPEFFAFGVWKEGYRSYSTEGKGPHSIYLNWLARFGIFGLAAFFWLLFGLVRSTLRMCKLFSRDKMAMTAAWIISYLALGSYNESGFMEPCFYAVMAFIFVQVRLGVAQSRTENIAL